MLTLLIPQCFTANSKMTWIEVQKRHQKYPTLNQIHRRDAWTKIRSGKGKAPKFSIDKQTDSGSCENWCRSMRKEIASEPLSLRPKFGPQFCSRLRRSSLRSWLFKRRRFQGRFPDWFQIRPIHNDLQHEQPIYRMLCNRDWHYRLYNIRHSSRVTLQTVYRESRLALNESTWMKYGNR